MVSTPFLFWDSPLFWVPPLGCLDIYHLFIIYVANAISILLFEYQACFVLAFGDGVLPVLVGLGLERKMALLLNHSMLKHQLGNIQPLSVRDLYEYKETVITYENGYKDNICNGLLDWDKSI